jgi:hypothetical protein
VCNVRKFQRDYITKAEKSFVKAEGYVPLPEDTCMVCKGDGECSVCGSSGKFSEALRLAVLTRDHK